MLNNLIYKTALVPIKLTLNNPLRFVADLDNIRPTFLGKVKNSR